MFFVFFTVLSMTQTGLQAFAVAALVTLHDMPVATASLGLSVYLFTSAAGVLLGGELADRTTRHDLFAGAVFGLTAVVTVIFAVVSLPAALLALLMGVIGLGQGATRPARDMMLRAATPKGSTGKVFGFVTSGIAVGSALAPIPLGHLLDIGQPAWVFYLISIFMVVAIVSMLLQQTSASGSAARVGA
jgi:FSR family fosmidomycin resistance protein-like MFS transporter